MLSLNFDFILNLYFRIYEMKVLSTGNEVLAKAALAAGAELFFGYPITPTSEVLENWAKLVGDPKNPGKSPVTGNSLQILQCEDEMSSGFALMGATLAGKKAFTVTAGPGNVLMQDAYSSAEAMRLPVVSYIGQRGGLSTSTVIYSQEEVTLTCFGGNGEGFRIVYSTAGLQDLYDYGIKAFSTAWKYRFPTFVLYDGYQGKMLSEVDLYDPIPSDLFPATPIMLNPDKQTSVNMRNCYNMEEEINEIIEKYQKDFDAIADDVAEYEEEFIDDAEQVIVAHGIVATAAKTAVRMLREQGKKIGYFRPITLRPLPTKRLRQVAKQAGEFLIVESAMGQFSRLIKNDIYDIGTPISEMFRPAIGISPEEIVKEVLK